jgi:hypothetical protein
MDSFSQSQCRAVFPLDRQITEFRQMTVWMIVLVVDPLPSLHGKVVWDNGESLAGLLV